MKLLKGLVLILIIALATAVFTLFKLQKEVIQYQQSAIAAHHQIQKKDIQISQLSRKIFHLELRRVSKTQPVLLTYKLKNGDSLSELFGARHQKIAAMNKIKNADNIPVGKIIHFYGRLHKVQRNENLIKIGGESWRQIARLNDFNPKQAGIIYAGQTLKIAN